VHALARDRTALVALAGATVLAWIGLARLDEPMGVSAFLLGWTLMMAAMMLPSVAPLVLLYRGSRTLLAVGYLAVWRSSVSARGRSWRTMSLRRSPSCWRSPASTS
jgi:predicted metal-binding membrane protein